MRQLESFYRSSKLCVLMYKAICLDGRNCSICLAKVNSGVWRSQPKVTFGFVVG